MTTAGAVDAQVVGRPRDGTSRAVDVSNVVDLTGGAGLPTPPTWHIRSHATDGDDQPEARTRSFRRSGQNGIPVVS
jgi:hypothetical protein